MISLTFFTDCTSSIVKLTLNVSSNSVTSTKALKESQLSVFSGEVSSFISSSSNSRTFERSKYNFNQLFLRLMKLNVGRARVEPILEILGGIAMFFGYP